MFDRNNFYVIKYILTEFHNDYIKLIIKIHNILLINKNLTGMHIINTCKRIVFS